jgi:hypothetical protein
MRLTRDAVTSIAIDWAATRYPSVPPVSSVTEFSEERLTAVERATGETFDPEERRRYRGKWLVGFSETPGMWHALMVWVDDETGLVEICGPPSPNQ